MPNYRFQVDDIPAVDLAIKHSVALGNVSTPDYDIRIAHFPADR